MKAKEHGRNRKDTGAGSGPGVIVHEPQVAEGVSREKAAGGTQHLRAVAGPPEDSPVGLLGYKSKMITVRHLQGPRAQPQAALRGDPMVTMRPLVH